MKRRKWIQTVIAAPALAQTSTQASAAQSSAPARSPDDPVKLALSAPGVTAAAFSPRFFSEQQFATLTALAGLIFPERNSRPGAVAAEAPQFLDFLLSQSPPARQDLYRTGLDLVSAESRRLYKKDFAAINATEARTILAPLDTPWTFDPPADPLANFLKAAKDDIFQATMSSRPWSEAQTAARSRSGGGMGQYYFTID